MIRAPSLPARSSRPRSSASIQRAASQGGFIGTLVARDQTNAMIVAELRFGRTLAQGTRRGDVAWRTCMPGGPAGRARTRVRDPGSSASPSRSVTSPTAHSARLAHGHRGAARRSCDDRRRQNSSPPLVVLSALSGPACSLASLVWQRANHHAAPATGSNGSRCWCHFMVFAIGVSDHGVHRSTACAKDSSTEPERHPPPRAPASPPMNEIPGRWRWSPAIAVPS